jgi:molybdopterin converting factor small subunit
MIDCLSDCLAAHLSAAMPTVSFASHLRDLAPPDSHPVTGETVAEALGQVWRQFPALRSYILDDQGAVRRHIAIFVDGSRITDLQCQSDPVRQDSEICVLQALSGG